MIVLYLQDGSTLESADETFDLTPLGVRYDDRNSTGVKTGEWTIIPWASIREVRRVKNSPREHAQIPSTDLRA